MSPRYLSLYALLTALACSPNSAPPVGPAPARVAAPTSEPAAATPTTPATSPTPVVPETASPAPTPAPAPPPAISEEQRQRYLRHLRKGRADGDQKRWPAAIASFEAALVDIPNDARAASELGWAAFQAGDFQKARTANALAVRTALEPKLKAASLYNAGRVAEAAGQVDDARSMYEQSLALRPHKTVERRLRKLGKASKPAITRVSQCRRPQTQKKLCKCLGDGYPDGSHEEAETYGKCSQVGKKSVEGFQIWRLYDERSAGEPYQHVLVRRTPQGWSAQAKLGSVYGYDLHAMEKFEIPRMAAETTHGKRLLWLETIEDKAYHIQYGVSAGKHRLRTLTLCTVEDTARCPLQVITSWHSEATLIAPDPQKAIEDTSDPAVVWFRNNFGAKVPWIEKREVDVTVDPDGTAHAVMRAGVAKGAQNLGDHKVW